MTGQIIPLHSDEHREAQLLLPWYATDRLDPEDRRRFELHLAGCAECQAEVAAEGALRRAVVELPAAVEPGWERLRAGLPPRARRPNRLIAAIKAFWTPAAAQVWGWRLDAGALRGVVAAQFVILATLTTVVVVGLQQPARYQAMGAAPAAQAPAGNLVLMFRPETTEGELRAILGAYGLRLVEGPNAAGAWVVRAAPAERANVLAKLRLRREIVLAEPVDAAGRP